MIKVTHQFHEHEGGTKFYETVLFADEDGGPSVLVKRFGKVAQRGGGGQYKIEDYPTKTDAVMAHAKIWREKNKPKEYSRQVNIAHGFGLNLGGESNAYDSHTQLLQDTEGHYSDKGTADTILSFLSLKDKYDPFAGKEPEPKWEPTVTEEFGTW